MLCVAGHVESGSDKRDALPASRGLKRKAVDQGVKCDSDCNELVSRERVEKYAICNWANSAI